MPGAGTIIWVPLDSVIEFKRSVYEQALSELVRFIDLDRRNRQRHGSLNESGGGPIKE